MPCRGPGLRLSRSDPEHEALLAHSVGSALLVVLQTLTPAERIAFVLHDLFAVPFDQVGSVLGRTPDAAKQLAGRARRRVRGSSPDGARDPVRQQEAVRAFLAASRGGDLAGLLELLDPAVVLRVVFGFTVAGGRVVGTDLLVGIDLLADAGRLGDRTLALLEG